MPTPEEIKKLSDAYAEYMCPVGDHCGGVYDDQRNTDLPIYKDDAKSVLEWLSKDYCIVPKEVIRKEYEEAKTMHDIYTTATCINECESRAIDHTEGRMYELTTLFGTELFNEEKEVNNA